MIVEITVKTKDGKTLKYNNQAEAIKNARIAAGMTQEDVATKLGIKYQQYQQYEYGSRNPKDSTLEQIAKILNVDINVLLCINALD